MVQHRVWEHRRLLLDDLTHTQPIYTSRETANASSGSGAVGFDVYRQAEVLTVDDLQRQVLQAIYDYFKGSGEWPRVRWLELQFEGQLDAVGGLQYVSIQIGSDKILCGSPYSDTDVCKLRLKGIQLCEGSSDDIENFLSAVRYTGKRYRASDGASVTVSAKEWVDNLGMTELEARKVAAMFWESHLWSQAAHPPDDWSSFNPNYFASKVADVASLDQFLERYDQHIDRERQAAFAFHEAQRPTPARPVKPKRVFISHAAIDRKLAECFAEQLLDMEFFLASVPGNIPAGAEWLTTIQSELKQADYFVVIVTPNSVDRPWVWFETGAAWMSEREWVTVAAGGISVGEIPLPIAAYQIASLENPEEAADAFAKLGIEIDSESFSKTIHRIGNDAFEASILQQGWEAIVIGRRIFAWDGPKLHGLEDRSEDYVPANLEERLRAAGHKPYHATRAKLGNHLRDGCCRVFETDGKRWRRALSPDGPGGETVLIVRPCKPD